MPRTRRNGSRHSSEACAGTPALRTTTPALSSIMRISPVMSSDARPCPMARRHRRADCSNACSGTARSAASASPNVTSFSITAMVAPKSKWPVSTLRGTMSVLTKLRPVLAFRTCTTVSASSPALAPITRASKAEAMFAATTRLFTSFIAWPSPGRSPTRWIDRPTRPRTGSARNRFSVEPDAMMASVPARAPPGPPLTGASRKPIPCPASPAAMRSTLLRPIVDIST